ncbi:hypothetical protein EUGRSUZ_K03540 [Eucalyptus grandis]|uniref:Uncharacterized protein n=2 Tax=Eucalyptus grandis TaxID=71139 RepID=A0ACC3J0C9_EUCGR|nr:hypothetical protein EUGRSUZ_K03540 [Eucalyptus grandis]
MGNYASIRHQARPTSIVLLYDGSTREFDDPPTVAELMLDHTQHVVVEFRSAVDGTRRLTALPADKKLEARKLYIMLPMMNKQLQRRSHRDNGSGNKLPPLSAEESRRFLMMANSALRMRPFNSKPKAAFMPVLSRVCADAKDHTSGERRLPEFREIMLENSNDMVMMSRQVSGKAWRPSLEAIMEKKVEEVKKAPPHFLFQRGKSLKSN